jgi:hypothetical protein
VSLAEPVFLGWFGLLGSLTQCDLALERQRMPDGAWIDTPAGVAHSVPETDDHHALSHDGNTQRIQESRPLSVRSRIVCIGSGIARLVWGCRFKSVLTANLFQIG